MFYMASHPHTHKHFCHNKVQASLVGNYGYVTSSHKFFAFIISASRNMDVPEPSFNNADEDHDEDIKGPWFMR